MYCIFYYFKPENRVRSSLFLPDSPLQKETGQGLVKGLISWSHTIFLDPCLQVLSAWSAMVQCWCFVVGRCRSCSQDMGTWHQKKCMLKTYNVMFFYQQISRIRYLKECIERKKFIGKHFCKLFFFNSNYSNM